MTKRTVKQIIDEQNKHNRCIVCHKKFKRKTEIEFVDAGVEYKGNYQLISRDKNYSHRFEGDKFIHRDKLSLWDGESYHDYLKPFCGKDCSYKYAKYVYDLRGKKTKDVLTLIHRHSKTYTIVADKENK